jgi:PAS domain S-box-containing protein
VARLEYDAQGKPVSLHGIAQDITERKEVEEQLRIRDYAIESSINGIGITDLEGKLVYVNEACLRMWGFESRDEVIGRFLPEFWEGDGVLKTVRALHETGGDVGEETGRRKDGSLFPVQFSASMIQDETGAPMYMLGSFIDISEKKQAEEKLIQRERSLAGAQRIAHVGDWEWDRVADKSVWSDEVFRIFGFKPEQVEPNYARFMEHVHPDDHERVEKVLEQALEDALSEFSLQFRIRRQDGAVRVVQERGEVIVDGEGNPTRIIGTIHDITELKAMETESRLLRDELAHHDRVATMGTLTAAIAHETNQPLTAIQSSAQAALRFLDATQVDLDEVRESLRDIVANNKRAGELIQRLRAMAQKEPFHREPMYLNSLVADVLRLIDSEIAARQVSVILALDSDLPVVYGDPVQTQQVILNLLINALEALEEQPDDTCRILVSTKSEEDSGVLVAIVDSGPGVEAEKLDAIFEPFHTTKTTGMGLGLSVCRTILEAHDGHLWAENNPQGGASFSFSLPSGKDDHQ